jgi:hypothetical protein
LQLALSSELKNTVPYYWDVGEAVPNLEKDPATAVHSAVSCFTQTLSGRPATMNHKGPAFS